MHFLFFLTSAYCKCLLDTCSRSCIQSSPFTIGACSDSAFVGRQQRPLSGWPFTPASSHCLCQCVFICGRKKVENMQSFSMRRQDQKHTWLRDWNVERCLVHFLSWNDKIMNVLSCGFYRISCCSSPLDGHDEREIFFFFSLWRIISIYIINVEQPSLKRSWACERLRWIYIYKCFIEFSGWNMGMQSS